MAYMFAAERRRRTLLAASLLFFLISFLGWCMEKGWFLLAYGVNADRGFLRLPFCTVYGSVTALVRAAFGEPLSHGERYPCTLLSVLVYSAGAALAATATEIAVGLLFGHVFGVQLWSYRNYPVRLTEYACLPMSLAWGFLLAVAVKAVWIPLERRLVRAPEALLKGANAVLWTAVLLDLALCAFGR